MRLTIIVLATALFCAPAYAGVWDKPRRGSWLTEGEPVLGDVVLARDGRVCEIVVSKTEGSAVHTAAGFLAGDIEKICGVKPSIVDVQSGAVPAIHLATVGAGGIPPDVGDNLIEGAWEEYVISVGGSEVWLVGSNPRGTAFAAYELCERMGIDPLYHWTGYEPVQRNPLALQSGFFIRNGPAFKFRGMFHDDEDILPRPLDDRGYPLKTGVIETQWYERWFETALRLRCNMVAPYNKVERRNEIQQLASDWGLFYTSHNYDPVLSNPWGFDRFGLGDARGVEGDYNWTGNKYGMLDYWEGGVVENRKLNCLWPLGLSRPFQLGNPWPLDTTQAQINAAFSEAIAVQMAMADTILEDGKPRLFHFTLDRELLEAYQAGALMVPDEVIIVWDDDGDGRMRGLPEAVDPHPHGVYYHLAFNDYTGTKQGPAHTVSPERINSEFEQIVEAGATEFLLLNVSELRSMVMETRMVMDLAWRPEAAFNDEKHGNGFIDWWAEEYFAGNAEKVAEAYRDYYRLLPGWQWQWHGSVQVEQVLRELQRKFAGEEYALPDLNNISALVEREWQLKQALKACDKAASKLDETRRQFFYENVILALLVEFRHSMCAIELNEALLEQDNEKAWVMVQEAMQPLITLEEEIQKAERPPFEGWYNPTWLRYNSSDENIHRPLFQLQNFWESGGTQVYAEEE